MRTLAGIFLFLYAFERGFETFRSRRKLPGRIIAPYSLPFILVAYVSFYLVLLWDWSVMKQFSGYNVVTGVMLVLLSIIGRNWSIATLGRYHSIHIEIRERHDLIQTGPYQFVRNPYYLSNIIEAFGLLLIVDFGRAWIIAVFIYLPLLIHRLFLEQRALEEKFEVDFTRYREETPLLIPRCFVKTATGPK